MSDERWYMMARDGRATLCADRADAEHEARNADTAWPAMGPHRAVQLVEAGFDACDMATAAAQGFRDGVASLSLPAAGQEPVAWRTFDGEGGYDYRTYDDNESYRAEWEKRNPNHKGWVEPLYAAPQPAVAAGWQSIETAPKDGSYLLLWEQYSDAPFVGYWSDGSWSVSHEHVDAEGGWDGANVVDALSMPITHWMPLPAAPGPADGESNG